MLPFELLGLERILYGARRPFQVIEIASEIRRAARQLAADSSSDEKVRSVLFWKVGMRLTVAVGALRAVKREGRPSIRLASP
jgi:hypothetical protein